MIGTGDTSADVLLNVIPGSLGGITASIAGLNELVSVSDRAMSALGNSMTAVDGAVIALGALFVTAGTQAASAAGDFQRSMNIVQAVSGQTNAEISIMTQKAQEFSVTYKMGIDEVTDGMATLGRAGLSSVNTQLDTMQAGFQMAKVEGMALNDALEKIVQTTSLMGGDMTSSGFGSQTQEMSDMLLATSMAGPLDVNDVIQTLQYSGGTAAAGGINLENKDALYDYLGAISAFSQKGVTGSVAGTAMRAFFTKPASQDSQVTEGLKNIGLTPDALWEDGGQKMKTVSEQISIIEGAMSKMPAMDQIETWGKIVGPKMGQQMMKLTSADVKESAADIKQQQSGSELSNKTMQNYSSSVDQLGQQAQVVWRNFGAQAVTWLQPAINIAQKLMEILSNPVAVFATGAALTLILSKFIQKIIQIIRAVSNLKGQFKELISESVGFGQRQSINAEEVNKINRNLQSTDNKRSEER